MFRSTYSMLFLVLSTVSLFGGRLKADEPIQETSSHLEETSVSFERRQFTVSRHKGMILFDGAEAPRQILANKSKEVRLIETFDGLQFASDKAFIQWAHKLKGIRTYTYDEVSRISRDGTNVTQPLVFFDKEQRNELDLRWHAWLDERQAEIEKANRIRLAQEQEAKRYQQLSNLQELQAQALSAQAAAAERSAESLAVISGATSLWEVELVPTGNSSFCTSCAPNFGGLYYGSQTTGLSFLANGNSLTSTFGSNFNYSNGSKSIYVSAYGRTSQIASDYALNSRQGYRVGSIRKLAGY
jgi:hypothetical protein